MRIPVAAFAFASLLAACVTDAPITPGQDSSVMDGTSGADTGTGMDSGSSSDASDSGATFTPASFGADLAIWIVGDKVSTVSNKVAIWPDQSVHKSDLS